jgi:putative ubiquitin-RnfH superfamily antitoxin RatB of RatAB toxin-antitoxin module
LQSPLRDLDRVEIYRPLTVDPKVARRQRFNKQGAKAAGLFARKRAGAKAGY